MPNHSRNNPNPPPPPPQNQGDTMTPSYKPYANAALDTSGEYTHRNDGGVFVRYGSPIARELRPFPRDFSVGDAIHAQDNPQTPNPEFTATKKAGISPILILVILGIILTSK